MSGGTPIGGGIMRQRHSQGYISGEDLEDDASSAMSSVTMPIPKSQTWIKIVRDIIWIASAAFIFYFGDLQSNFFSILWRDKRIKRMALYLGLVSTLVKLCIILYTNIVKRDARILDDNWDVLTPATAPVVAVIGLVSFCLYSFALWPIWGFLTLPLVFTLFMAVVVISFYLVGGTSRQRASIFRLD